MKKKKVVTYEVRWENGDKRTEHILWSDAVNFFNHLVKGGQVGVNLFELRIIHSDIK
jgi:hypothetical protein